MLCQRISQSWPETYKKAHPSLPFAQPCRSKQIRGKRSGLLTVLARNIQKGTPIITVCSTLQIKTCARQEIWAPVLTKQCHPCAPCAKYTTGTGDVSVVTTSFLARAASSVMSDARGIPPEPLSKGLGSPVRSVRGSSTADRSGAAFCTLLACASLHMRVRNHRKLHWS